MPVDPRPLIAALWLGVSLAAVLWVPGLLALRACSHDSRGFDRLAMATGVSVTLWPLALLWSGVVGLTWTPRGVQLAVAIAVSGLIVVAWLDARRSRAGGGPGRVNARERVTVSAAVLAVVLAIGVVLRWSHARGLAVTPWVDGLHHTLIVQMILEAGSVPDGFGPFLPVDGFYYHFGFHTLAAATAFLSGATPVKATLWTGQALSALAPLTVFALALRLTRHRASAVLAAAVPAALYFFPSYFVSWGRYTQLAGLVALPAVWIMVVEAVVRTRPVRAQAVAAACAAGLLLTHYRVFAFFLIGMAVLAGYGLLARAWSGERVARTAAVSVAAATLVSPWLTGHLLPGVRGLDAAGATWFGDGAGRASVDTGLARVPRWVFEAALNAACIGFAAHGLLVGIMQRRVGALLLAASGVATMAVVFPGWLGLDVSWTLPPFAVAISAFLPVAIGIGLLADGGIDLAGVRGRVRVGERAVLGLTLTLAVVGAWALRDVVNPETIIATEEDVAAAAWIRRHTPPDAVFLASTYAWHLGTYRGLDGGYWLPVLADRRATIPPSFYVYGSTEDVKEISEVAEIAQRGDRLSDAELSALMSRAGADHAYVGPGAAGKDGKLSAERLARHPELVEVYANGPVHVFRRIPAGR